MEIEFGRRMRCRARMEHWSRATTKKKCDLLEILGWHGTLEVALVLIEDWLIEDSRVPTVHERTQTQGASCWTPVCQAR
ncbi:hypothetical protein HBI25_134940 [Parastagonospora nodorum]|nr:hypothetical protein HBI95_247510 [Parastagonospora nodorum]KAH5014088.1 hypothetical protein HBI74_183510 [Parastagonospora nodorum]KAH5056622.1 hypothetical protein HBI73_219810 [Parastagonospora nodorum]KAH5113545.1 hypothetical protein HBH71_156340 [Parastagonospora nodorum]KAH5175815.1 hypothetical protein HBH76_219980 [Parastagonospora nodorum]